jgi:hypothetical protein
MEQQLFPAHPITTLILVLAIFVQELISLPLIVPRPLFTLLVLPLPSLAREFALIAAQSMLTGFHAQILPTPLHAPSILTISAVLNVLLVEL